MAATKFIENGTTSFVLNLVTGKTELGLTDSGAKAAINFVTAFS